MWQKWTFHRGIVRGGKSLAAGGAPQRAAGQQGAQVGAMLPHNEYNFAVTMETWCSVSSILSHICQLVFVIHYLMLISST